ncbi:hypothetical protein C8R46DRAFT_1270436 [Mycena filopes]|nr:hypothetical protein C8R46DRAFT_1270436 [Mycena filopes]
MQFRISVIITLAFGAFVAQAIPVQRPEDPAVRNVPELLRRFPGRSNLEAASYTSAFKTLKLRLMVRELECVLAKKYGPKADLAEWESENLHFVLSSPDTLSRASLEVIVANKVLLKAQGALIALATQMLDHENFEHAWTALDIEKQKDFVLDGLVRAAFHSREPSRMDCPETCLFSLVGEERPGVVLGPDFMQLLKEIVAHGPPNESVYMFSHPVVDREYAYATDDATGYTPAYRAFGRLRLLHRNIYIVQTLLGTLKAYTGVPAVRITLQAEWDARVNGTGCVGCYSCGATPLDDGVTLAKCSGCRSVTYCSGECQRRDWCEHKKLCKSVGAKR